MTGSDYADSQPAAWILEMPRNRLTCGEEIRTFVLGLAAQATTPGVREKMRQPSDGSDA
jgi:hypothetical protein